MTTSKTVELSVIVLGQKNRESEVQVRQLKLSQANHLR